MRVFWAAKKRGKDGKKHYTGLMVDENLYIYKFYYTPKSPRFIRISGIGFGIPDDPYNLSVQAAKRRIYQNGYSTLDIVSFGNQCPQFDDTLGEYLIVRRLRDGI